MPKGYLIAHVSVSDATAYAAYAEAAGDAIKAFGPNVIAAWGKFENLEGETHERHVVLEFDSFAEAKRFYESPAYQRAKALRVGAATGTFVILEGMA